MIGDRRAHVRLEVVGTLWGTLQALRPARVLELTPNGALIASPSAYAPDSVQRIRLSIDGNDVTVDACVRHVRAVDHPSGRLEYHLGVEFVSPIAFG